MVAVIRRWDESTTYAPAGPASGPRSAVTWLAEPTTPTARRLLEDVTLLAVALSGPAERTVDTELAERLRSAVGQLDRAAQQMLRSPATGLVPPSSAVQPVG